MTDSRKLTFDFLLNDKLSAGMDKIGQHSEKLHGKLGKLGSAGMGGLTKMAGAAGAGLAALGLSVAGVGAAISKGLDAQAATSKLKAQLDLTATESKKIGSAAGKLYSQAYGQSMDEVKTSIASVVRNMDGMRAASSKSLQDVTGRAMNLATIMDEDVGGVTRAVSQLMRTHLVKNSTEAFDLITKATQAGVNKSEDLLDTINEYSTKFRDVGISGPKAFGLISQAIKAGARDADTAADAIKEFAIRSRTAADPNTIAGFTALNLNVGETARVFARGGPAADKMFSTVITRLKAMKDPVERNKAAVALFGTKAEDLGQALYALDPSTAVAGLGKLAGASDRAGTALGNNLKTKLVSFKRTIETNVTNFIESRVLPGLTKLGEQMGKGFKAGDAGKNATLFEKVGAAMKKVADWAKKDLVPALRDLWKWFKEKIAPAVEKFYSTQLENLMGYWREIKKALDRNSGSLKSFGQMLKKVAEFVAKYVAPALAWLYGKEFKLLGKAIGWLIDYLALSWKAFQWWGKILFSVANSVVRTFLSMAGNVIHAAAKAFGWMPGIGPKLKAADKAFSGFAKKVNGAINSITQSKTVRIAVKAAGKWSVSGAAIGAAGFDSGGPVPYAGPGSSRSRDSVHGLLRVDEHVLTPEEVDAMGGHRGVFRLRAMARKGLLRFRGGGPVGVSVATSLPPAGTGAPMWRPIEAGMVAMVKKMAALLAKMGGGSIGVVREARRWLRFPYSWGGGGLSGPSFGIGRGAGTFGFDCSGLTQRAWWGGAHKDIGGVTDSQWANSRPIGGPRPGALAFPSGPSVHVMLGSDKPGYVIQAPYTGAFVEEVRRSSGNWRMPMYAGGPVRRLGGRFTMGLGSSADAAMARAGMIAGGARIRSRARGGPVSPGYSYLVGDGGGAEVFSPGARGTISPAGSRVTNVNLTVIVQGHALATKRQLADEVLSALRSAKKDGVNVVVN